MRDPVSLSRLPFPGLRRGLLLAPLLGACLAAGSAEARLNSLSKLFVFGDSLSDGGNSGLINGNAIGAPTFPPFPPTPYVGGRFSNGPVAAEYLWKAFNPNDTSFKPSMAGGTNYAVGGASSGLTNVISLRPASTNFAPSAYQNVGNAWQLPQFVNTPPSFDPKSSLFVVWYFPNDVFWWSATAPKDSQGAIIGDGYGVGTFDNQPPSTNPIKPTSIGANAVSNVIGTIKALAEKGARSFLVPNAANMGATPEYAGTTLSPLLTGLSKQFNADLAKALADLAVAQPELDIMPFMTDEFFSEVQANGSAYGFTNVQNRCTTTPACVGNPAAQSSFLFWDGNHPTTAGHQLLGQRFFQRVVEVPGPLPAAGAAAAYVWSRSLRRCIRLRCQKTSRSCAGRCPEG